MSPRFNPPGSGFLNPPGRKPINRNVPRGDNQVGNRRGQKQGPKSPNPRSNKGNQHSGKGQGQGRNPEREYLRPPTQKSINQQTRAATETKFNPLEHKIAADLRASERRVGEEGDWWKNYLDTVNAGQADTSAAYAQAASTQQGQMAQASQADSAATAQLQAEAAKSAELRGAPTDLSGAQREVAAQGIRNYLATAQGGTTALQGAAQRGYLNEAKRIGVGQSIASRKEEQRRGRSIRADRRDVARERGAYATTKRGELEAQGRDYLIQRKAFGLEKKEANQKANESALERTEKQRKERYERKQDQIGNRQAQERIGISKQSNKPGKNGLTASEQRDAREGRQGAVKAAWSLYRAAKKPPKTAQEWAAFESLLRAESEVSPSEAAFAIKKLKARIGNAPTQGNRGLPGATVVPNAP